MRSLRSFHVKPLIPRAYLRVMNSQGLVKKSMIENANTTVLLVTTTKEEAGGFLNLQTSGILMF